MKTLAHRFASVVFGFSLFLSTGQWARATISVQSTNSFGDVTIVAASGSVEYMSPGLQSAAFAQAGANSQYDSIDPSAASSTDVPVAGGEATGLGAASAALFSGSSGATGFVPGALNGFDTSAGRASVSGEFEIIGTTQPVEVTFSAFITGQLNLSSDANGVQGEGENVFSLSINGNPVLFNDQPLTIGPDQTQGATVSETLTDTMLLTPDTTYSLWVEGDSEAMVVNSVPEPPAVWLAAEGLALLALIYLARQRIAARGAHRGLLMILGIAMAGLAPPAHAMYIGSDAPDICKTCGAQPTRQPGGAADTSLSEGNIRQDYTAATVMSGYGLTIPFVLTYNSYNADGSKAQLDTGLGFGWSHTYNVLLFQQRGQMFRLGADGRVTQYYMNYSGAGGTYTSDAGYFETMTKQSDGSFIVTNKNQSWWQFGSVSNTPFLVAGPVYRLLQMGDRNQNVTTFTYDAGGRMTTAQDPYGRTLQFTYDSSNHMTSVTDPLGRTTQFQYDSLDRELMRITDPLGNSVQYTYNAQYQITRKVDRDGRMYFYTYKSLRPFMVADGNGQPYFSMSNPTDWSVNTSNLAFSLSRQYSPSTTTSTDGDGRAWQYSYDTNGYITQRTAPDGATLLYTYDPSTHKISSITDADGNTTRYQYDGEGNRIQTTDALGNVTTYTYEPLFNQMTSMTDPNGRVTTNNYDSHGNLILSTDPLGQTQSWTYDSHGNVLSSTDKRGYTSQYQYDGNGNPLKKIDPLGDTTTYSYDAVGNRLSVTDANGHTTSYQYDSLNRLTQVTDPLGHTNTVTYDGVGDVLSRTDANGHTTSYGYDARARQVAAIDALGGVTQSAYDANNNVLSRTDQDGHTTSYTYDVQNRPIGTTDALGNVSTTTYDPVGNMITATDANGHATAYSYDVLNRRISVTDPLGNVTTYDYANTGGPPCCGATAGSDLVTGSVDGDGKITYYNYDELNRLIQTVQKSGSSTTNITPSDAVTTYQYDANNNRIAVTDPNTNTTTYTYDAINRQIGMTNAAGDVSTTAYDAVGNVIQTVDPRGNVTTTIYDADNRRIQMTDSVGPLLGTAYDPVGNVISTTNGDGNVTITTYDAINRVIQTTDPLGLSTTYTYDPVGNRLSTTDRNGNTSTYMYDAINRQTNTIDPLGHANTTAYDGVGNVISITDPLGHVTSYMYDSDNRRIQETYPDTPSDTRSYAYDATGHLISRLDQNGQTTTYQYNDFYYMTNRQYSVGPSDQYIYDLGGRVIAASRNGWTDSFTYDGANRPLTAVQNGQSVTYSYVIPSGIRTIAYPSGTNVTESYDLRSRLIQVNDGGTPALTQYTYDLDNNVLVRTNRNGTAGLYTYNANDWVTNLTHTNSSILIAGYVYAYDNEGNRTYQMNRAVPTNSESYSYDADYRLTNYDVGVLSGGIISSPSTAESFGLDADGNWTTYASNNVTRTNTDNAVNEMLTINGSPLTYDGNGNLTNDGQYSYAYDVENRLTAVTRLTGSVLVGQYSYDAMGRRVIAVASPAGSSVTNVMFYDNFRIIEDQNAGGTTQAIYTYGAYLDEALTMVRGGQTYYYHPNALYSVEALTDSTGTPVERYVYDSYGEPTVLNGSYGALPANAWGTPHSAVTNFYLFTGRELDEETGLYFYRARYYDSVKGRFLQRDPLGYVNGMDLYEFVKDNPVNHADPSGTDCNGTGKIKSGGGSGACECRNGKCDPNLDTEEKCKAQEGTRWVPAPHYCDDGGAAAAAFSISVITSPAGETQLAAGDKKCCACYQFGVRQFTGECGFWFTVRCQLTGTGWSVSEIPCGSGSTTLTDNGCFSAFNMAPPATQTLAANPPAKTCCQCYNYGVPTSCHNGKCGWFSNFSCLLGKGQNEDLPGKTCVGGTKCK